MLKIVEGNTQLPQDFEKERWADLAAAMQGDGDRAAIGMVPALVATGLACALEAELADDRLEFAGGGACLPQAG